MAVLSSVRVFDPCIFTSLYLRRSIVSGTRAFAITLKCFWAKFFRMTGVVYGELPFYDLKFYVFVERLIIFPREGFLLPSKLLCGEDQIGFLVTALFIF